MEKVDELTDVLVKHIKEIIENGGASEHEIAEYTKALAELVIARVVVEKMIPIPKEQYTDLADLGIYTSTCESKELEPFSFTVMEYNYSKLKGRIVEKFETQQKFAAAMEWSERTLCLKLSNKVFWKQPEISKAAVLLEIQVNDIHKFFFTLQSGDA